MAKRKLKYFTVYLLAPLIIWDHISAATEEEAIEKAKKKTKKEFLERDPIYQFMAVEE